MFPRCKLSERIACIGLLQSVLYQGGVIINIEHRCLVHFIYSRGNKYQLMVKSRLRDGPEPAVFVPEVAKQHDVYFLRKTSAIAFGVFVSVRANTSETLRVLQRRFDKNCTCSPDCLSQKQKLKVPLTFFSSESEHIPRNFCENILRFAQNANFL